MNKTVPFHMLKDLAAKEEQKALTALGEANGKLDHAKSQLSMLEQYRQDYLLRLQETMVQGTRSSIAANTQRFIDNIDVAIAKQKLQVQSVEKLAAQQKENWLLQRKKTQSMSALLDRQQNREIAFLNKQEQKMNDEFAMQAYRRMQSTGTRSR